MYIGLVNYNHSKIGGSQSFNKALKTGFESLGYNVYLHTGSSQVDDDLCIVSQPSHNKVDSVGVVVHVSHSFFVPMERLMRNHQNPVAVSKEIQNIEIKRGITPRVIPNPIDLNIFELIPGKDRVQKLLYLRHDGGKARGTIETACKRMGIEYTQLKDKSTTLEVAEQIKEADIVVGIGRCLLEGMASGKVCISGDHRKWMNGFTGAGQITEQNYDTFEYDNFSGRSNPMEITSEYIQDVIDKYDPKTGISVSNRIRKTHNAETVAQQYLRYLSD